MPGKYRVRAIKYVTLWSGLTKVKYVTVLLVLPVGMWALACCPNETYGGGGGEAY